MSTKYKVMTDAELIDEGLDCDVDSLAYELAVTLDALPIKHGDIQASDDKPCGGCEDLQREINSLEWDVSQLQNDIDNLDMDRLIAGVKAAKQAVKSAHNRVNFILGLGGDNE
ncbi:hypothetical protein [Psychrobacter vallis]|uniref:hypothetical protein n=1 Tax=Psychrobacter vallis TaxID=248451 RepID=UPI001917E169|nr:hypothetical protein [Psychrobacter vallis]